MQFDLQLMHLMTFVTSKYQTIFFPDLIPASKYISATLISQVWLENIQTSLYRILVQNFVIPQLVKTILRSYGTRRLSTVFTRSRHCNKFWVM
jgi:hypothetical protein